MYECGPNSETVEVNTASKSDEIKIPNLDVLDVPVAIRKGTRTCTKHPLHLYPNHKDFLYNLNTIPIPKTLFEALGDKIWKGGDEGSGEKRIWELVKLSSG